MIKQAIIFLAKSAGLLVKTRPCLKLHRGFGRIELLRRMDGEENNFRQKWLIRNLSSEGELECMEYSEVLALRPWLMEFS